ncbi:MAG TPA: hypothetical protein VLQ48_08540 [Chloroflexia bacterium]|nr:hypothetical protein [Chloroflexia bacterium]
MQHPSRDARLRILFLHHSVGRNLIRQGGVRELVAEQNRRYGTAHEFWDHDYNDLGLTGPSGERVNRSFDIPDDNTDPVGLDLLFSQPVHTPRDNALSHLLTFDVVVLKSCFPASAIDSLAQLEKYQQHYLALREKVSFHPNILFIVMSPPPLVPRPLMGALLSPGSRWMWTNQGDADRAREFSRWLISEEFCGGLPNFASFDLFDLLAEDAGVKQNRNMLRAEYRSGRLGQDAHPNEHANRLIAPVFVAALWESIERFRQQVLGSLAAIS